MAVMMPRQNWTDERLGYFEKSVDERFERVDERFVEVNKRLDQLDQRLERLEGAMLRQNTTMVTGFIGLAGLIASSALFF
jgi:tetrahydromethanopterin S-methyltransferase subunit G